MNGNENNLTRTGNNSTMGLADDPPKVVQFATFKGAMSINMNDMVFNESTLPLPVQGSEEDIAQYYKDQLALVEKEKGKLVAKAKDIYTATARPMQFTSDPTMIHATQYVSNNPNYLSYLSREDQKEYNDLDNQSKQIIQNINQVIYEQEMFKTSQQPEVQQFFKRPEIYHFATNGERSDILKILRNHTSQKNSETIGFDLDEKTRNNIVKHYVSTVDPKILEFQLEEKAVNYFNNQMPSKDGKVRDFDKYQQQQQMDMLAKAMQEEMRKETVNYVKIGEIRSQMDALKKEMNETRDFAYDPITWIS